MMLYDMMLYRPYIDLVKALAPASSYLTSCSRCLLSTHLIFTSSEIHDGTKASCGGSFCKKVSKMFSHQRSTSILQACDGAEACIVSCQPANKVWDGNGYQDEAENDRISKLSEITGLTLTDINIEDLNGLHHNCDQAQ